MNETQAAEVAAAKKEKEEYERKTTDFMNK